MHFPDRDTLSSLMVDNGRSPAERECLVTVMDLLARLPHPPDPFDLMPRYGELKEAFIAAASGNDGDAAEEAFLELYCHLHGHEAPYSESERRRVDETGGYWCHAGGLAPILKAGPHIRADTVLADFGAGNGLQGLLMQVLHPHRRTVQIEISARMVEAGRSLQGWLGIPIERVEWIVGDVLDASPKGMDFIYLYRPVRPTGEGRRFYEKIAAELAADQRPVVIFSIADCLRDFLSDAFEVFFSDGHLTCFRHRDRTRRPPDGSMKP